MIAFALYAGRIALIPALLWGLGWVLGEFGRIGQRRP